MAITISAGNCQSDVTERLPTTAKTLWMCGVTWQSDLLKGKHCWLCTLIPSPLGTCELLAWTQDAFRRAWGHADRWAGGVTCQRNGMCFKSWVTRPKYSSKDVRTAVWSGCLHRRSKKQPFASHCNSGCEELGTRHLHGVYMIRVLSWHYLIKQYRTLLRHVWPSIHWWDNRWGKLCFGHQCFFQDLPSPFPLLISLSPSMQKALCARL